MKLISIFSLNNGYQFTENIKQSTVVYIKIYVCVNHNHFMNVNKQIYFHNLTNINYKIGYILCMFQTEENKNKTYNLNLNVISEVKFNF